MSGSALRRWFQQVFTLDVRSLALFRIGLGTLVAVDAAIRSADIELFYTDAGVRPRPSLLDAFVTNPRPSLHLLGGSVAFEAALFALTMAVGVLLALGWRTRVMGVAAWLLVLSAQNRNVSVNTGADTVLLLCCMIGVFLPLSARCSLDARRQPESRPVEQQILSAASVVLVLQVLILYVFNVVNKTGATWFNGTAVLRALHIDQHATPLGLLLRAHAPWLSPPLTVGTLLVEGAVVLLLLPVARDAVRSGLVIAMWGLHLGLALCLYIGLFSPACMVAWLAFIPSGAWQWRPLSKLRGFAPGTAPMPRTPWAAALFLAIVFGTQLTVNVTRTLDVSTPAPVNAVARALALGQAWRMFAANPSRHDGWWVIAGETHDGRSVDLLRGGAPVTWDKPTNVAQLYPTSRWRKFMMNISVPEQKTLRRRTSRWFCRDWDRHHPDARIKAVHWTFMLETTARNYRLRPAVKRQDMGRFVCEPKVGRAP